MRIGPQTVAVITGGAHGIGRALASELNLRGASVALIDVDRAGLEAAAATLSRCTTHICDVSDAKAVDDACKAIARTYGRVHVLVNNAGISVAGAVETLPPEHFQRAMAVNFWGVVHCCQAFLPLLRASAIHREPAAICNVLSDFAIMALPTKAAYACSKYAARAFTEALQAELDGTGIAVTAAYPGATATDLVRRGYAVDPMKQQQESEFLARGMHPETVAVRILRGIERGQGRLLIGRDARIADLAMRLSPNLFHFALKRLWRRIPFL